MKRTTLEEVSAGGVVFRTVGKLRKPDVQSVRSPDLIQFLVGKHSGYHKWVLPKGLVEQGESYMEAAVREVEEEVGVSARVVAISPIKTIEYDYFADLASKLGVGAGGEMTERRVKRYQEDGGDKVGVHKKVVFFLMALSYELPSHGWEMEARKWVSYEEGMRLLSFESEREVLESAMKDLVV